MIEAVMYALLFVFVLLIVWTLLLSIVYARCDTTLFAALPPFPADCPTDYCCGNRPAWKWTNLTECCGLSVWDTMVADDPSKPVVILAPGLFVNWQDQRRIIEWLVTNAGVRVIAVFYRVFEGACTETRVHDLNQAYEEYIVPQLANKEFVLLGISWGCTVITQWLTTNTINAANLRRVVLLHPVLGFWNAAQRLAPGLSFYIKYNRNPKNSDQGVGIRHNILELQNRGYPVVVVCAEEDLFTDTCCWMTWARHHHVPAVQFCCTGDYSPYNQHFYSRYLWDNWKQWKPLLFERVPRLEYQSSL